MGTCSTLQGTTQEEHWDTVKKGALYKKCLMSGHIASRCRAPPMCKKCCKYHHTLLHIIEADPKTEDKRVSKDMDPRGIFEMRRRGAIDDLSS